VFRTAVVAARLAPIVLSFVRDHRRWIVSGEPVARTPAFHRRRAERIVRTLGRLGPAFVKLAQLFASRPDLVPEPYLGALGILTDQVPPIPPAKLRRAIEEAYGKPPEEVFDDFEVTPVAAASLGQVHRARWRGEVVAVKVLRPNVEKLVEADVRAAGRLLDLAIARWPNPHIVGVRNAVREFGERVWEEMDFRREAANAEAVRANFAGRPGVRVPRVIPELTRHRAMVMEFMHGTRIDRLGPEVAAGRVDAVALVRRVIELYMRMMLVDGFFHADPHPGNLLVQDDGTVVILDFGMVVRVAPELRHKLARTAFAGITRDVEGLVDGFFALGVAESGADRETIRRLVETLLAVAYTPSTTTVERMELIADEVMATLYDFPVTLPSELVYFARTAALIEGLGTRYDAQFNGVTFAAPVALSLRREILATLRGPGGKRAPLAGDDWVEALGGALGEVAAIVTRAGRDVATVVGRVAAGFGLLDFGAELGAALWGDGGGGGGASNGNGNGHRNGHAPSPAPPRLPAGARPAELPAGTLRALPAPSGD
jgi:predicted unusual protein kinase regulating ubiquinone biosynthesis (AarF/ABC1/UbiB family)